MINTYKKYAANVFVASCPEQHEKGDVIILTTKRGDEHECIVHNYLGKYKEEHLYSITRADGFNRQERARRKAEKYNEWADSRHRKGDEWYEKSKEGHEFLRLAEPIKVGHHSEKRHRALIERNHLRMDNAMENYKKGKEHQKKAKIWEDKIDKIDLSMPKSLEYFEYMYEKTFEEHKNLKENPELRVHSYSLQYANKRKNDMKKRYDMAKKLWG